MNVINTHHHRSYHHQAEQQQQTVHYVISVTPDGRVHTSRPSYATTTTTHQMIRCSAPPADSTSYRHPMNKQQVPVNYAPATTRYHQLQPTSTTTAAAHQQHIHHHHAIVTPPQPNAQCSCPSQTNVYAAPPLPPPPAYVQGPPTRSAIVPPSFAAPVPRPPLHPSTLSDQEKDVVSMLLGMQQGSGNANIGHDPVPVQQLKFQHGTNSTTQACVSPACYRDPHANIVSSSNHASAPLTTSRRNSNVIPVSIGNNSLTLPSIASANLPAGSSSNGAGDSRGPMEVAVDVNVASSFVATADNQNHQDLLHQDQDQDHDLYDEDSSQGGDSSSSQSNLPRLKPMRKNDTVRWVKQYLQLQKFRAEKGHCLVPTKSHDYPQLGPWVSSQRYQYKKRQRGELSSMTDGRLNALDALDFVWSIDVPWEERFEELVSFKNKYGHCKVPRNYGVNPELGRWVHAQRTAYKKFRDNKRCKITQERIDKLDALGFIWDAHAFRHLGKNVVAKSNSAGGAKKADTFVAPKSEPMSCNRE